MMHSRNDQSMRKLIEPPMPQIPLIDQRTGVVTILPLSLIQVSPVVTSLEIKKGLEVDVPRLASPSAKIYLQDLYHEKNQSLLGTRTNSNCLQIHWNIDRDGDDNDIFDETNEIEENTAKNSVDDKNEAPTERGIRRQLIISSGILFHRTSAIARASTSDNDILSQSSRVDPIIIFPSQDPTDVDGIPCLVHGYSIPYCNSDRTINAIKSPSQHLHSYSFEITNATMVQILLPVEAEWIDRDTMCCRTSAVTSITNGEGKSYRQDQGTGAHNLIRTTSLLSELSGEASTHHKYNDANFLLYYHEETVNALTIRMRMLMERQIMVGTTDDAVSLWQEDKRRRKRIDRALDTILSLNEKFSKDVTSQNNDDNTFDHGFLQDGALTVHDPTHGSGKSTLVATIARTKLNCNAIHMINASTLFAQYGASGADAALESLLHRIVLSAAVVNMSTNTIGKICIVLDNLESFVHPRMSGGRDTGDPAIPALNAIQAYLTKVVDMIRTMGAFPFPTKNPFYNIRGKDGYVIPVQILIVGIVTCDDDGGRKAAGSGFHNGTVLDTLGENRYRLPSPSINTGIEIYDRLFQKYSIILSPDAREELPFLVSSMPNMKGASFQSIIQKLNQRTQANLSKGNIDVCISENELKIAFKQGNGNTSSLNVSRAKESSQKEKQRSPTTNLLFSTIGGNEKAKKSLLDALAFDKRKRMILSKFGLSAPTGVLLYGPPGNGKTLLAKATAQMMEPDPRDDNPTGALKQMGGLFISLSASDIVRSEVGGSEKLVAKAFETARDNSPSVIFIDEFQALFTSRDGVGGGGKSSGRLASTLLQCMDDISKWRDSDQSVAASTIDNEFESDRIVVLGATNTPWMVDRAFLRAGRFDRVVHVGLPTERERESILQVHVQRMKLSSSTNVIEICKTMAQETVGFSGADIAALVRSAAVRCLNETSTIEGNGVEMRHFLDARKFDLTEPSSNNTLVEKLLKWRP